MEKIEKKFLSYFKENKLKFSNKYLLAVSGGVDSMVVLHLFLKFQYNFSVSSCNFRLRGNESKKDLLFIESYCKKNKVNFYSKEFDTDDYANKNKISIQMSSRELRYDWFKSFLNKNYDFIVTAHHSDDNIETILYNMIKTTGYNGLVGIPHLANNIIRPMLGIDKKDILLYAEKHNLKWREDSSNTNDKYLRNKIRNKLIPIINEINPSFKDSIKKSIKRLGNVQKYIRDESKNFISIYEKKKKKYIEITKSFLKEEINYSVLLHEYISSFGFNYDQTSQIIISLKKSDNKKFYSEDYVLINDRTSFYIFKKDSFKRQCFKIKEFGNISVGSYKISIKKYKTKNFIINQNNNNAQCDYDKVSFPLMIRNYENGEKFIPLGMINNKKISSFLSDKKISFIDKLDQLVVVDAKNNIIWLVGQQLNNKFKINSKTKNVLELEII